MTYGSAPTPSISPTAVDWGTSADIATTVGAAVAILAVLVTLIMTLRSERLTREGQQLQRREFEATARRTEAAAALTEEYTRRVVDALETIARHGPPTVNVGASEASRPSVVRWSLTHLSGSRYVLENVGDKRAYGVELSTHPTLEILDEPEAQDMEPGEAISFLAAPSMGTEDLTVTVRWREANDLTSDGEQRSWRYPLPVGG